MTKEEQGQCLKAFRCRIGLENQSEAARELSEEAGLGDEDSLRKQIRRHENEQVTPRDGVLAAWSAVARRRGFRRRTGKKTKVLLKEIFRPQTSLEDWMASLSELVHESELPRELPMVSGFGGSGSRRLPNGSFLQNESFLETVYLDDYVRHVRCWGPQRFWIEQPMVVEKTDSPEAQAIRSLSRADYIPFRDRVAGGEDIAAALKATTGIEPCAIVEPRTALDNRVVLTFYLEEGESKDLVLDAEFGVQQGDVHPLIDNHERSERVEEYLRRLRG